MEIKKLNESLKQIINELSDETKQWAVDERTARYLAAQATADREKEKLDKLKRTKKNLEPKPKKEVISSLEKITKSVSFIGTDFSEVKEENGNFVVVINDANVKNGKLTKSAEEQLKKQLEKMSKLYGCKYTYEINGTKVKIICEKPKIIDLYDEQERIYNICKSMVGKELKPVKDMEWDYDPMGGWYGYINYDNDEIAIYISTSDVYYPDKEGLSCICISSSVYDKDNCIDIEPNTSEKKIKSMFKKFYNKFLDELNNDKEYTFADWYGEDLTGQTYEGDIGCEQQGLTSLKGSPEKVNGNFWCYNNNLTSLEGAPKKVTGTFNCENNNLTDLEGAPKEVTGSFYCDWNKLTTLKGASKYVGGSFYCDRNNLTSLKGAPKYVGGEFNCKGNSKLTSLEGIGEVKGQIYSDIED